MSTTDARKLYAEDEILLKLENAMAEASGAVKSDIQAAIEERKKELRDN
ncbi:hypothetical protein [Halapricum desulfuricans]|nr:hypothetical protein [Halapricum desulfuricans]